jgi:hypothetical protein
VAWPDEITLSEEKTVSIIRVGSTKQYADGWEAAFAKGKKKTTAAAKSVKATTKKATKAVKSATKSAVKSVKKTVKKKK